MSSHNVFVEEVMCVWEDALDENLEIWGTPKGKRMKEKGIDKRSGILIAAAKKYLIDNNEMRKLVHSG